MPLLLLVAVLGFEIGAANVTNRRVTDADLREVLKQTLKAEIDGQKVNYDDEEITDFELLLRARGGIVLSSANVKRTLVRPFSNTQLVVLTPREIQAKANREGDFLYLKFTQIRIAKSRVLVTLSKQWARSHTSTIMYTSGGSSTFEFRKIRGKWTRRFVKGRVV